MRLAPQAARNDAHLLVELAAAYGTELDPWQVDVLEAGCGVREDGSWAAETVGCNVARQNGKSVILVIRALAGLLLFGEENIACSAHRQGTSRELFRALRGFFDNYDDLRRKVKAVSAALGREAIELRSGARVLFPARTRQSMRGWSFDVHLVDEGQLVTDEHWQDSKPTQGTRSGRQTWLFGTAPQLTTDAEVFGKIRAAAHVGTDERLAWVEFGAEPGSDPDDREQWRAANPGRVQLSAMEAERRELSAGAFCTERLNIWPSDRAEQVFDMDRWASLAADGPAQGTVPSAIGIDASHKREFAVAVAWRVDDGVHVELLDAGYCDPLDALEYVVERAARKRVPVLINSTSPASVLKVPLEAQRCKVKLTHTPDMARACGGLVDDVAAWRLTNADRSPQSLLTAAAAGVRKRPVGDAGAFVWDLRDGSLPMAPLVAVTLARFGAANTARSGRATFV